MTRHPDIHTVDIVCATCGSAFTVRSTASSLTVDSCSSCHPAYTGARAITARGDRIERFNRRRELAAV
jgi:large subunit ribosomal protein L31